jgi:hypothetical protein
VILPVIGALALAVVDPCAPVVPASTPDREAAAQARAVAGEEEAAGQAETAAAAWRLAASLDPADATAPAALRRLCRPRDAAAEGDPFGAGVRAMDAGRYADAAERFRAVRAGSGRVDAALLEGICRYELGEDAEATRLLREAEAEAAHRETARLYLGLLALREGAAREASTLFDEAASNPLLAPFARDLARSAAWDGPLLLTLLAEAGYDSNVSLTSAQVGPSNKGDALGGLSLGAVARPFGANGPFLRATAGAQEYARLERYDLTLLEGAAGWRWWKDGTGVTGEYAYGSRTLDGNAYLTTNRLLATGALSLGPVTLGAAWQGRWESYATAYSPWSGFAQRADGRVTVALGPRLRLGAGWSWARDATDDPVLAWSEQGPRADLRWLQGARSRLLLEAGAAVRTWDRHDPGVIYEASASASAVQRDVIVEGSAAWEWDLNARTTFRLGVLVRTESSNVPAFDYGAKVVPTASIGVMMAP